MCSTDGIKCQVFEAASDGGMNIDNWAWNGRFPAQVCGFLECRGSPECTGAQVRVSRHINYKPILETTITRALSHATPRDSMLRMNRVTMINPKQLNKLLMVFEAQGTLEQEANSLRAVPNVPWPELQCSNVTIGATDSVNSGSVKPDIPVADDLDLTDEEKAWLLAEGIANDTLGGLDEGQEQDMTQPIQPLQTPEVPVPAQVASWSVQDVVNFLQTLGLVEHTKIFEAEQIDGDCLTMMGDNDLLEMGITSYGHRKLLLLYTQNPEQTTVLQSQIAKTGMSGHEVSVESLVAELEARDLMEISQACKQHAVCIAVLLVMDAKEIRDLFKVTSLSETLGLQQFIEEISGTQEVKDAENAVEQALLLVGETDVPERFMCPIKCDVMVDPVIASDGTTYERECIDMWLQNHSTSPMTNEPLPNKRLKANKALLRDIRLFYEARQNVRS